MGETKENQKELYKDIETNGTVDERAVKPTINTDESEVLKENDKEILIGKKLEEVDKIKEEFSSKRRKLLNKLMK